MARASNGPIFILFINYFVEKKHKLITFEISIKITYKQTFIFQIWWGEPGGGPKFHQWWGGLVGTMSNLIVLELGLGYVNFYASARSI